MACIGDNGSIIEDEYNIAEDIGNPVSIDSLVTYIEMGVRNCQTIRSILMRQSTRIRKEASQRTLEGS